MTNKDLNIAIVGGGPTGLMLGILLSRLGIKATLIERQVWPIDKVCGEGIMPTGVALLEKYHLLKFIDLEQSRNFVGVKYINNDGQCAVGDFQNKSGKVIRRLALSQGLYTAAREEKLLTLIAHHELLAINEKQNSVEITIRNVETKVEEKLSGFIYLIGADGINSKVRKLKKMSGHAPGKQSNRIGARVHYCIKPWDNRVQVWWHNGIECYVAPTSKNCVEFNFGWDHDQVKPQVQMKGQGLEAGLFSFFPELQEKIKGADRLSPLRSWGPLPHQARVPLSGRIALIGDAGLFYDQITGEGLSLAFLQAELVAHTITKWDTANGREKFIQTLNGVAKSYIKITDLAMFLTRHPLFRKLMIWILSRSPRLFSHLLHVNMGDRTLY